LTGGRGRGIGLSSLRNRLFITGRGSAFPGAGFGLSQRFRLTGWRFDRAGSDLRSVKEAGCDRVEDGAQEKAMGYAGDEVANVFGAGKRRHGDAICFVGAKLAGDLSPALGSGGFKGAGPGFATAEDGCVFEAGRQGKAVGWVVLGHDFSPRQQDGWVVDFIVRVEAEIICKRDFGISSRLIEEDRWGIEGRRANARSQNRDF